MLLLSRRNHQGLVIEPDASIPKDMKVSELFGEEGILIKVIGIEDGVVKLGIDAPETFKILRDELESWDGDSPPPNKKPKTHGANMYRRRRN